MRTLALIVALSASLPPFASRAAEIPLVQSVRSGGWSEATTWSGGKVPPAGSRVLIRAPHEVLYDAAEASPVRALFIAGTLRFAPDRDTRLEVGLLKIQDGEETSEEGFDCEAHAHEASRAALLVGTAEHPVEAGHTALIRLTYFEGMNKESCPAIVCCGGRMEFHGAPLSRTWVKLGAPATAGASEVTLSEAVAGWRVGNHLFLTGTTRQSKREKTFKVSVRQGTQTEERTVRAINGPQLTLDRPLEFDHTADGEYRGEVANLSRNVIVESADPAGVRGHTMYHRGSRGSIEYAEFRHLGKEGVLGRYSIHFHLVRDTMRGAAVIGASIWDSANRWITIHGTDYLVVRDCVGYQSIGHGFFLEDGTESFNVLDRNLAVQACIGQPLPKQLLPYDHNDGAGFWWANCRNTFTRNVAAECDEYGYRFDAVETPALSMTMNVPQPDGTRHATDIRTLPFVRFEDNEAHCQRRHSFNLGGNDAALKTSVDGVGPDAQHPFVVRGVKAWNVHWAFHTLSPCVMLDGLDVHHAEYALWRMNYDRCAIRGTKFDDISVNPDFSPNKGTHPAAADFPKPLDAVDDLPPATVITQVLPQAGGALLVRGTTSDNGEVRRVIVNGVEAKSLGKNFAEWELTLPAGPNPLRAHAEDAAGNVESREHVLTVAGNGT
jgi:hypothetical protein